MPVKGLMLFSLLAMASAELAMAAQLETASGLVQARDMREDGGWVTAGSGWALAAGTAVRTGEEGRVVATLPGALLALEGSSNLALVRIEGSTQMILARGVMTLVVEDASGVALQVATPRGVAEIHQPGRYLIEAGDAVRPMRLSVFDGAARLVTGDSAQPATTGQVAWVALDNVTRLGATGSPVAEWPARPVMPATAVILAAPEPVPAAAPAPEPILAVAPARISGAAPAAMPVAAVIPPTTTATEAPVAVPAAVPVAAAAAALANQPATPPAAVDRPAASARTTPAASAARTTTTTRSSARVATPPRSRQAAQTTRAPAQPSRPQSRQASTSTQRPAARPATTTQRTAPATGTRQSTQATPDRQS